MTATKKKPVSAKKPTVQMSTAKKTTAKKINNILKLPRPSLVSQLTGHGERLSPQLQALVDKNEINEVVNSFARAIDRTDENLLRSVLHADATLDFGPGVFQGVGNDYVHWVLGVMQ